ncbi:transporter substrate-binding domain-containing protein [Neorhizobium sp. DT-125]|uniref:transporter substrate-binding domain-containing protein n=1 Tax=Neorhizobium sp. DT-125 TaxID=3396163 RepID=UPI003F1D643C
MKLVAIATLIAASICSAAHADKLADIKAKGSLTCGVFGDLVPLGFQDPKSRTTVGFDVDVCAGVAKSLGVKLELQTLSVASRIPSLTTDRVDVVAAAMGYTAERAKQIAFSSAYIQVPIPVLVKTASGIKSFDDLKGKRVSAIRASNPEAKARQVLKNSSIITYDDGPLAFLALQQGKVDAMTISQAAAVGFRNRAEGQVVFLDEVLHWEPDCIGVKLGEAALLEAVNKSLADMEASGELQAIWDKWFGPNTEYKLERVKKLTELKDFQ